MPPADLQVVFTQVIPLKKQHTGRAFCQALTLIFLITTTFPVHAAWTYRCTISGGKAEIGRYPLAPGSGAPVEFVFLGENNQTLTVTDDQGGDSLRLTSYMNDIRSALKEAGRYNLSRTSILIWNSANPYGSRVIFTSLVAYNAYVTASLGYGGAVECCPGGVHRWALRRPESDSVLSTLF
ncbi:hypothetical protein C1B90_21350 [Salmonella enterica]|uniref:Uncharacterized protein n=1 Tax=Salmonella enterica TaxID=28901 RepID=A0A5T4LNC4_SALER|nr:hypothetical protein [Salmonella enterica]